jgi:hypothetical protein
MAVTQAGAQRLLHVGELHEAERGCHVDHPVGRNGAGDGVDELRKSTRLLNGEVDALKDLQASWKP